MLNKFHILIGLNIMLLLMEVHYTYAFFGESMPSNCKNPDDFECSPDNICISHSLVCDGHNDCANQKDEENCGIL